MTDKPSRPLREALAHRTFRLVWIGVFASSVGTWMQNVALGAFAYRLTGRSSFGAILGLAQNGPQFILATVGGVLADTRDRVRLMQIMQTGMLVVCVVLTFEVRSASPSKLLLFWTVVALGACNALNGPVFNSLTPGLVPREHLPGVVALMSTQLNLSRVVGPALGGLLQPKIDVWGVFLLNSISYLAVIIVLSEAAVFSFSFSAASAPYCAKVVTLDDIWLCNSEIAFAIGAGASVVPMRQPVIA